MRTADYVDKRVAKYKKKGLTLHEIAWKIALLCVGWSYIFGDRGQYCTPSHRRAVYAKHGDKHPTIKSKCKNYQGTGACSGCTFYPGGKTRAFDCRGFTYWIFKTVYDFTIWGGTVTAQWNDKRNWKAKGRIDTMPKDTICCLFVYKDGKWPHTGLGLNNETIECSSGVQHFTSRNPKWTHWAVPACVEGEIHPEPSPEPEPTPPPTPSRPTIRRGSSGVYVKELQTILSKAGYNIGATGIDGKFGRRTETAVKEFQQANNLTADGIVGKATWSALLKL